MFKRLKLWYWKWFRPSKYYAYHIAPHAVAGLLAGLEAAKKEAGE